MHPDPACLQGEATAFFHVGAFVWSFAVSTHPLNMCKLGRVDSGHTDGARQFILHGAERTAPGEAQWRPSQAPAVMISRWGLVL